MINARVRPTIKVIAASIGSLTLNVRTGETVKGTNIRGARFWIIADDSTPPVGIARYAYNDKMRRGAVTWVDVGTVLYATQRNLGGAIVWDVVLDQPDEPADGDVISLQIVQAPGCSTCGMGAVGSAGPSDEAHYVDYVRADEYAFIRRG